MLFTRTYEKKGFASAIRNALDQLPARRGEYLIKYLNFDRETMRFGHVNIYFDKHWGETVLEMLKHSTSDFVKLNRYGKGQPDAIILDSQLTVYPPRVKIYYNNHNLNH